MNVFPVAANTFGDAGNIFSVADNTFFAMENTIPPADNTFLDAGKVFIPAAAAGMPGGDPAHPRAQARTAGLRMRVTSMAVCRCREKLDNSGEKVDQRIESAWMLRRFGGSSEIRTRDQRIESVWMLRRAWWVVSESNRRPAD